MFNFLKKRIKSFGFAFAGIGVALQQTNFKIQISAAIIAVILGFVLDISLFEWIVVISLSGIVLTAEIINTSIEEIVNFISPEKNNKAKIIKDLAAGAVLVVALTAFIVGLIIFIPKIFMQL